MLEDLRATAFIILLDAEIFPISTRNKHSNDFGDLSTIFSISFSSNFAAPKSPERISSVSQGMSKVTANQVSGKPRKLKAE